MKRVWFFVMALIVGVSVVDYGGSAGHYGLLMAGGIVAVLLLVAKSIE